MYNNLAIETTSELLNTPTVDESDYKNYLIALGYYKSNNLPQALKYINNAIAREKQLKKWKRAWKYNLIETMNPNWQDLAEDLENNILYWKNKETV